MDFPDSTNDDTTDVSLITGALRTSCLQSTSEQTSGSSWTSSVALRNPTLTVANTNTAGKALKRVHASSFPLDETLKEITTDNFLPINCRCFTFYAFVTVQDLYRQCGKCKRSFTPRYLFLS